jgi:hypothetical protein
MMAEVARFYEWFLHRSQREDCAPYVPKDGRLHIFPTFSPEHWGIVTQRFERNRDSASAIAFRVRSGMLARVVRFRVLRPAMLVAVVGVAVCRADGGKASLGHKTLFGYVRAWEMMPANPY